MNDEIQNALVNDEEGELNEDNMDNESDEDEDLELDESEDEYYDEMNSEILEAVNRSTDHLQLLLKSFNSELGLCDTKEFWYRRFLKELEFAIETVQQVEDELFEFPD